ncbi:hypothetical protein [Catellatospora sp. NPDC049609]|uniref:hypothetical protein n=1 Tax=Catellatospora sp. NPDC049609 TaxID=3155505 RepID=UPI0034287BC8
MERKLAGHALHFDALPATGLDLPEPYEPLIALWERGGRFRRENGLVYFGVLGMRAGPLRERL